MNINNNIFDTKEEYLAFRNHWKKLHADGFHKTLNPYTQDSQLDAWHHLVFNLAIGRTPPRKAFRIPDEPSQFKPELYYIIERKYHSKLFGNFPGVLTQEHKDRIKVRIREFLLML
jgi:hypothetical protein